VDVVRAVGDVVQVGVRAMPGAKRTEIAGVVNGEVRVRLAAPAVDGRANVELIRFLARLLGVRRSAVTIRRGMTSRVKVVEVAGVTVSACRDKLIGQREP
jgi:uncharacterized protein (TIGR00251 family)